MANGQGEVGAKDEVIDLSKLDEFQKAAVEFDRGAALVVSGPGSGKTRCLTYRIANLIEHGCRPSKIIAITFSNLAAAEMRNRVGKLIGMEPDSLKNTICTFHSFGFRALMRHRSSLSFKLSYSPLDLGGTSRMLRMVASDREALGRKLHVKELRAYISLCKREDRTCEEDLAENPESPYALGYALYESRKQEEGKIDFDDMVFLCWRLLHDDPEVLADEQARCEYLLVDEAHDCDLVQMRISKALAGRTGNAWFVADFNQSIYSWRGGSYHFCKYFEVWFPDYKQFILGTNYRSLPGIVGTYKRVIHGCGSLVDGFLDQIKHFREPVSETVTGDPQFMEFGTDMAEADWVTNSILEWRNQGEKDMAIIYRTNRQACLFEEALFRKKIPYIVQGSTSFFSRAEVKDLLAFLRLLNDRNDNDALERIIKCGAECSRYLGTVFFKKLAEGGEHWFQNLVTVYVPKEFQREKARKLHRFIEDLDASTQGLKVDRQLGIIARRSGLMEALLDNEAYEESADNDASENIPQVVKVAEPFNDRQAFLEYVKRVSDAAERRFDEREMPVRLMTLHRGKGLEFSIVYLVGANDTLLPHRRSHRDPEALEEEQRLAYVGVSRAMDRLFVTCFDEPSRFFIKEFGATKVAKVVETPNLESV